MRLGDLLEHSELGLRVVYATPADLDREFRWTYQTDLLDPRRYLEGGELVLSGMSWRTSPADSEVFAQALADAGAIGLVAGDLVFGDVPGDVVAACRRHGLPVLGLDSAVSFVTVTEFVLDEARTERRERLDAARGRHRELLALLAAGQSLDALVDAVARDTGVTCRIFAAAGLPVTSAPPLPEAHLDAVTRAFVEAPELPAHVAAGDGYSVFSVGPGLGNRLTSWLLVAGGDAAEWPLATTEAIGELAALAQLDRARRDEGRRALERPAADLFRLLASGGATPVEIAAALRQCGLDADAVLVVVIGGIDDSPWPGDERVLIADAVAQLGPSITGAWPDGHTAAVVQVTDERYRGRLTEVTRRLAPGLTGTPLSLGVSEPSISALLAGAAEEARHALTVAQRGTGEVRVTFGREIASSAALLASVAPEVRAIFADRVLRNVLDHDAESGAGLVATLRVFLECDCSWAAAAAELGVHVNTVRYRIERIELLTGRDLSTLAARMDFYLALQA